VLLSTIQVQNALAASEQTAIPGPEEARIVLSNRPGEHIKELGWYKYIAKVNFSPTPFVDFIGHFSLEDSSLIYDDKEIPVHPTSKKFALRIILTGKITPVTLKIVAANGEVRSEKFTVQFEGWDNRSRIAKDSSSPQTRQIGIVAGLGVASSNYTQTRTAGMSQRNFTFKASYQRPSSARSAWGWGTSMFVTVLPISSDRPDVTARFFGISTRLGYTFSFIPEPWQLGISAGAYYTTMITSGSNFGYRNVFGPMVYPSLRRALSNADSLSGYIKLSPITNGLTLLALSNRELAGGLSWTHRMASGNSFSVSTDVASFVLNSGKIIIKNDTISLSLAYGW